MSKKLILFISLNLLLGPVGNSIGQLPGTEVSDLGVMAAEWLVRGSGLEADVYEDGEVDFKNYAALSTMWLEEKLWPGP